MELNDLVNISACGLNGVAFQVGRARGLYYSRQKLNPLHLCSALAVGFQMVCHQHGLAELLEKRLSKEMAPNQFLYLVQQALLEPR